MEVKELVEQINDIIAGKKGSDITVIELMDVSTIADYFVIASADSDVQVKAIADDVDRTLAKQGIKCYHKEGYDSLNWVLLDYFDVVVHIFKKEAREYYNLEKFWGDAPSWIFKDEPEEKDNEENLEN